MQHIQNAADARTYSCVFRTYGGPEVLEWVESKARAPRAGEVSLRVMSASVNPVDWKIMKGLLVPATRPGKGPGGQKVFGSDFAGIVETVGTGVTGIDIADRVMGMVNPLSAGTWTTRLVLPARLVQKINSNMPFADIAALPAAGITALRILQGLKPGRWSKKAVLLNGASGGVGSLVLQMLVRHGAKVHAVASSARHQKLLRLGAETCSDYREISIRELGPRFDVIIDAHGSLLDTGPRPLFATDSREKLYVPVSIPNKDIPRELFRAAVRRLYGIKTHIVLAVPSRSTMSKLATLAETGALIPVVDKVYPMPDYRDAVAQSMLGHAFGKIVLDLSSGQP